MRITESQLRRIVRDEILKESVSDDAILNAVSRQNPVTDVVVEKISPDLVVKFYIPNSQKIVISQLRMAPRKWVLMQRITEGREWRETYYKPYVAIRTGTFDPETYKLTTDPQVDTVAADYVGGR